MGSGAKIQLILCLSTRSRWEVKFTSR